MQVQVRPHPLFKREGRHLYQELHLDFVDAILGADVTCASLAPCAIYAALSPSCSHHVLRASVSGLTHAVLGEAEWLEHTSAAALACAGYRSWKAPGG